MSDTTFTAKPYWERLRIERPRLETYISHPDLKLWHLLVAALLEHGRPAPLSLMARRLAQAGAIVPGNAEMAILRSWHGVAPVVRERDGRLAIDLSSRELEWVLSVLHLLPEGRTRVPPPPPPPEAADTDPLTPDELEAAFRDRSLWSLGSLRPAAAVLDARDQPMSVFEIERALAGLTTYRPRLDANTCRAWRTDLVVLRPDGRLEINRQSAALIPMRRGVRKLSRPLLVERWTSRHLREAFARAEAEQAQQDLERALAARHLRHLVVRVAPTTGTPVAAVLADVDSRQVWSFSGDAIAALPTRLLEYDVLAGLEIRHTLRALALEPDRWRLADLRPPQKTKRISRNGRAIALTPSLIVASTTGLTRPLADPAQVARYLHSHDTARLLRRLEMDAKALCAFYLYGRLHRAVRLRWGFLDDFLPVDWATPADRHISDLLREAMTTRALIDVVLGAAPGWLDPWERAQRVRVVALGVWEAVVQTDTHQFVVPKADFQAVRVAVGELPVAEPRAKILRWPEGTPVAAERG